MQKSVSEKATFALNVAKGWRVSEKTQPGICNLLVMSTNDRYQAMMSFGSIQGRDPYVIAVNHLRIVSQRHPDLKLGRVTSTKERTRFAFGGTFVLSRKRSPPDRIWPAKQHSTTSGQVTLEEFIDTDTSRFGQRCKAYSYGTTFDTRLQFGWHLWLWHVTVSTPVEQFTALVPSFVDMIQSFAADDRWAMDYIAEGMAGWPQLVMRTCRKVEQVSRDITDINRSIYQNNARSREHLDYSLHDTFDASRTGSRGRKVGQDIAWTRGGFRT